MAPPLLNQDGTASMATLLMCSHHGLRRDLAQVFARLPAALQARIPAARIAFEARCERVWGPRPPGASTTAIPDWLPGG